MTLGCLLNPPMSDFTYLSMRIDYNSTVRIKEINIYKALRHFVLKKNLVFLGKRFEIDLKRNFATSLNR